MIAALTWRDIVNARFDQTGYEDAFALLTHPAPALATADAELIAARHFGQQGRATPLTSERDQNFLLKTDSAQFVLKVSNAAEKPAVTEFQTGAVMHALATDSNLPLAAFLPATKGGWIQQIDAGGVRLSVRLLECVPGVALKSVAVRPTLDRELGALLAAVTLALENYDHPAAGHRIFWDLSHFSALDRLLPHITESALHSHLEACLSDYQTQLQLLQSLPRQVIYNDLNDSNVLVDPQDPQRITGLIDFGDIVKAPRIFDVAVAASYRLGSGPGKSNGAAQFIAGYETLAPLTALEKSLLPLLIRCRLATTVLVTGWRADQFPNNRNYILRNFPAARDALLNFQAEAIL